MREISVWRLQMVEKRTGCAPAVSKCNSAAGLGRFAEADILSGTPRGKRRRPGLADRRPIARGKLRPCSSTTVRAVRLQKVCVNIGHPKPVAS